MMYRRILVTCLWFAGCGEDNAPATLAITPLVDVNPDPSVVEVNLVATTGSAEYLDGKPADTWAYRDGSVEGSRPTTPGPLLDVPLGAHVIVHFRNELPDATTIHWHGLRVPNASDGSPVSQLPVAPGGTFDYTFDTLDAGTFWYHPHVEGDVQVERGLYGPIVVHDDVAIDVAADRVFVLDDVKLAASGKLDDTTDNLDLMLGRMGNVVLINGRQLPSIDAASGSRERWRFINAANGRYFNLELPGHVFRVIGWDGGLVEAPYETERLLVAPGERYDVLVELGGESGDTLALRTVYYDRGHNISDPGPIEILTIALGASGRAAGALPSTWGQVVPIAIGASTPRRPFVLREDDTIPDRPIFTINDEAFPNNTPVRAAAGVVEVWEIKNLAEMDHPFHLHGMSFQVLDAADRPIVPLGWKDTVNVPQLQTVRFAVRFDAPGRWMYHCHILEHAERGMMGELEVAP